MALVNLAEYEAKAREICRCRCSITIIEVFAQRNRIDVHENLLRREISTQAEMQALRRPSTFLSTIAGEDLAAHLVSPPRAVPHYLVN